MKTISGYIIIGIVVSFFLRTSIKDDLTLYDSFEQMDIQDAISGFVEEDINRNFFNESNIDIMEEVQVSSVEIINLEEE